MSRRSSTLAGLHYYGGKSGRRADGTGAWIASLLPCEPTQTYVEPYAGMLGVLLQRDPVQCEIANDLNDRIVNWWEVCRDRPDELLHKLKFQPYSESLYYRYRDSVDEGDAVERAAKLSLLLIASFAHGDTAGDSFTPQRGKSSRARAATPFLMNLERLADRLRHVQFLCRPAVDLLRWLTPVEQGMIYLDPPYETARKNYRVVEINHEELKEAMLAMPCKVAISGYNDEWDDLGWHRLEHETRSTKAKTSANFKRVEVLWTNFTPSRQESF